MSKSEPSHRRDFVRALALGAVVATPALADDPKTPDDKEKPKAPDEVEARLAIVLARFGKHAQLDDKARETIKREIAGIVRRGEALRKIPLGNGVGPFPVFHPYRAPLA
jgi:hypothetical protein